MAVRTSSSDVQATLFKDYDTLNAPSLTGFIASASIVVDRVAMCAIAKGITLTDTELELIERWLACHFYTRSDAAYSSRSHGGGSGSFLKNEEGYRQAAIDIDYSGCLSAILNKKTATASWLGKTDVEKLDYEERN